MCGRGDLGAWLKLPPATTTTLPPCATLRKMSMSGNEIVSSKILKLNDLTHLLYVWLNNRHRAGHLHFTNAAI